MTIAVFTTHPLFQRHFATELEILQDHLDAGDTAFILSCAGELLACETNKDHEPGLCALCRQTQHIGVNLLQSSSERLLRRPFLMLSDNDKTELQQLRTSFTSIDELKTYTIENFEIGLAALSSIVSHLRDLNVDVCSQENADVIRRYILASFTVYRSVQRFLDAQHAKGKPIEKFYVFNGRMSIARAVVRACQSRGVSFVVHEVGNDDTTYALFENHLFHEIAYTTHIIREAWNRAATNPAERERKASEWFQARARGAVVNGYTFVEKQQRGLLPRSWDETATNIVIFNSADFEYAMVGEEYNNHVYPNQLVGIQRIVEDLALYPNIHVYLRVHPNLATVPRELAPVMALRAPNLTTIPPDDPTSSYALMAAADRIVVFTSTVGIEAPFWDKPVILAGRANYQELGSTYNPNSHEEVMALLLQPELPPKDKTGSLQYGYFFNTFGIPFKRYKAHSYYGGTFNGTVPFAPRWRFRLHTVYKYLAPKRLQQARRRTFARHSLRALLRCNAVDP